MSPFFRSKFKHLATERWKQKSPTALPRRSIRAGARRVQGFVNRLEGAGGGASAAKAGAPGDVSGMARRARAAALQTAERRSTGDGRTSAALLPSPASNKTLPSKPSFHAPAHHTRRGTPPPRADAADLARARAREIVNSSAARLSSRGRGALISAAITRAPPLNDGRPASRLRPRGEVVAVAAPFAGMKAAGAGLARAAAARRPASRFSAEGGGGGGGCAIRGDEAGERGSRARGGSA